MPYGKFNKKNELIELRIDRKKWVRGGNGETQLLNREGRMCCIGFLCRAVGLSKDEIERYPVVGDLIRSRPQETDSQRNARIQSYQAAGILKAGKAPRDPAWINRCYDLNDDGSIVDEERERKLIKTFADKAGVTLKFYG